MPDKPRPQRRRTQNERLDSMAATILYGGPERAGLVHTVERVAATVETLSTTVATLASAMQGSNGVEARLTKLDDRLGSIEGTNKRAIAVIGGVLTFVTGRIIWDMLNGAHIVGGIK